MQAMIHDLVRHKWHANAALLGVIRAHEPAARDFDLRKLLHHILVANRVWLATSLERPFAYDEEMRIPATLAELIDQYRATQDQELPWVEQISDAGLSRILQPERLAGIRVSVREGIMQICLHSQGHRSQCAARFRSLGGTPPPTDYVIWLKERPDPVWP